MAGLDISTKYSDRQGYMNRLELVHSSYALVISQFVTGHFKTEATARNVEVELTTGNAHHEYSITPSGQLRNHICGTILDRDISHLLPYASAFYEAVRVRPEIEAKDLANIVLQILENK